jgi:GTP diphosphokinase / guanosine-3',5'-bis(diphosphate) 3'-diphosphatase
MMLLKIPLLRLATFKVQGFPPEVLAAIEALTKNPGESRIEAAHRAAQNPVPLVVKLADVTDNMDLHRIPNPTEKDFFTTQRICPGERHS